MSEALRRVAVVRVRGGARAEEADRAVTEEPRESRLHDRPFAVIMRTPGADRELAAGFLLAERVIRSADDLGTIAYCTDRSPDRVRHGDGDPPARAAGAAEADGGRLDGPGDGDEEAGVSRTSGNIVNVTLVNASRQAVERLLAERRHVTTTSSCGLCG